MAEENTAEVNTKETNTAEEKVIFFQSPEVECCDLNHTAKTFFEGGEEDQ